MQSSHFSKDPKSGPKWIPTIGFLPTLVNLLEQVMIPWQDSLSQME
ncbi:MAG: hypothetical protein SNJ85_11570 [Cyanobacteriota bacterium]